MGDRSERIADLKELVQVRWQAARVLVKASVAGAALTAIAVVL